MKLREDWRKCLKFISVWSIAANTALNSAWVLIPPSWQATIPDGTLKVLTYVLLGLTFIGIMIKQELK